MPGELFQVNSETSDSTRSLFDPSKMIIAKVESLSEDSQFNDYLNEILESEEVMECLNSINTANTFSVVDPPPFPPTATEVNEPAAISSNSTVLPLAASPTVLPLAASPTVLPLAASPTVLPLAASPTVQPLSTSVPTSVTTSSATLSTSESLSLAVAQPVESVAAYVAAETNLAPFTMHNCLTATHIDDTVSVGAPRSGPDPLLSMITSSGATPCVPSMVSAASRREEELKPKSNVMWSQSTVETHASLEIPTKKTPLQQAQMSTEGTSDTADEKSLLFSPSTTAKDSNAVSGSVEVCPAKKEVYRVRRKKRGNQEPASKVVERQKGRGKASKAAETVHQAPPPEPEVKSRNGRPIKPSWKVSEASNQSLKRTISPITIHGEPTVKHTDSTPKRKTAHARALQQQQKQQRGKQKVARVCLNKTTTTASTLSLSTTAVGGGLKRLPDIPATPCSPNPAVSLPSASSVISMSLDDILLQMNDEEPVEDKAQALEFAESLLANVTLDKEGEDDGAAAEVMSEDVEGGESSAERKHSLSDADGESGSLEKDDSPAETNLEVNFSTKQPQCMSEQLEYSDTLISLTTIQPPTPATLLATPLPKAAGVTDEREAPVQDEETCSQLSGESVEDDCTAIMMELCGSESSLVDFPVTPPQEGEEMSRQVEGGGVDGKEGRG